MTLYLGPISMAHLGALPTMLRELQKLLTFQQGWVCVRKECKKRFWLFAILSAGLLSISGVMFGSDGQ